MAALIEFVTKDLLEKYCHSNPDSSPECRLMLLETFIDHIKANQIPGFHFKAIDENKSEITHDKEKISFFSLSKNAYKDTKVHVNFVNFESYDYEVESLEQLNDVKQKISTKPFFLLTAIEATRDTNKLKNVLVGITNIRLVACIYPKSPNVKKTIDEAFSFAEDHMKSKKKFSFYLNYEIMFWDWYKEILKKVTGEEFYISSASFPIAKFQIDMKTKGFLNAMKFGDSKNFVVKDAKIDFVNSAQSILPEKF